MKKLNFHQFVIVIICFFSGSVWAQSANLSGTVKDASGAVVPNANVVLTGVNGVRRAAVIRDDGSFTFG